MQIFVKTLNGQTLTLCLQRTSSIVDVHQEIFHKLGVPQQDQRLTYQGQQLAAARALTDYLVCEAATVHLSARLRGGVRRSLPPLPE